MPKKRFGSFPTWKTAGVSFGLALSLAGGTGAYAYSSDEVLPQHPLYSVRMALEQAELTLPQSDQQRETVRIKHLQRRVSEAVKLNARHLPVPESHEETLLASLETVATPGPQTEDVVPDITAEKADESRELVRMDHQELSELIKERKTAGTDEDGQMLDEELSHQMERVNEDLGRLEKDREAQRQKRESDRQTDLEETP